MSIQILFSFKELPDIEKDACSFSQALDVVRKVEVE